MLFVLSVDAATLLDWCREWLSIASALMTRISLVSQLPLLCLRKPKMKVNQCVSALFW